MQLRIELKSDSAAFQDADAPGEIARILRDIAKRIEETAHGGGPVFDSNGNRCGFWTLALPDAEEEE